MGEFETNNEEAPSTPARVIQPQTPNAKPKTAKSAAGADFDACAPIFFLQRPPLLSQGAVAKW
jgi:hypothetical protein